MIIFVWPKKLDTKNCHYACQGKNDYLKNEVYRGEKHSCPNLSVTDMTLATGSTTFFIISHSVYPATHSGAAVRGAVSLRLRRPSVWPRQHRAPPLASRHWVDICQMRDRRSVLGPCPSRCLCLEPGCVPISVHPPRLPVSRRGMLQTDGGGSWKDSPFFSASRRRRFQSRISSNASSRPSFRPSVLCRSMSGLTNLLVK